MSSTAGAIRLTRTGYLKKTVGGQGPAPARMLQITAPASLERFAEEAGEPAQGPTLPPPAPLQVDRLLAAAARNEYDIEIKAPQSGQ